MNINELERDLDGNLPDSAWPGGYQIIYICVDGGVVCNVCATKFVDHPDEWNEEQCTIVGADLYQEGPTLQCEHCYRDIESDYGDPDAEEGI